MVLGLDIAAKYDFIFNFIQKMAGSYHLDFNNSVFLSERRSCDRNSALAHFMLENKCLPAGIEIKKIIDLYCQVIFTYFLTLIVPMYLICINLQQQIKKNLFQKLFWPFTQNFCKFLAFSLKITRVFLITRIISILS